MDEAVGIADADAGFGLSAMAERARLAGGEVEAGPQGAGFRVRLVIPVEIPSEI
jgi:signal transduction histidine kinase